MLNLRWSWHPPTVELFESIDPAGWAASGGDPVAMLSSMRPAQLAALAANEDFLLRLDAAGGRPARIHQRGALVPVGQRRREWRGRGGVAAARDRLLLTGVRHHRRAPAVLRRS